MRAEGVCLEKMERMDAVDEVVLSPRPGDAKGGRGGRPSSSSLSVTQLWASLPNPCKIFLGLCVVQAFTMGSFASIELVKEGRSNYQDLILLLVSSVMFLCIVVDAFWHENAYQLLVSMASGGLNLAQLVIYATSLSAGRDTVSITVACVCALLQLTLLGLTRWAYLGFGWRMYSKLAGDMRRPNIERTRNASLRLDRFLALAKIDIQLMVLLLIVGIINGINVGGTTYLPSLLVASTVGVVAAAVWLVLCWVAVTSGRPRLSLFAEFTHPFIYIVAASYMFSSVYYGDQLVQIHGQAYLIAFPVLFLIGRTLVWWDARLLSGSDLAIMHRDLYGTLPEHHGKGIGERERMERIDRMDRMDRMDRIERMERVERRDRLDRLTDEPMGLGTIRAHQRNVRVPTALVPLIRGSWLLKLPSYNPCKKASSKKLLLSSFGLARSGRWRFFQLSHDGSTLRWDWRKYVLLMHVESVHACVEDLTITLKFTLDPDLHLQCKDKETHADWTRGLTLLVMMLGNPDGLDGKQTFGSGSRMDSMTNPKQPPSPPKLLNRLTSGSLRASAAGLVTKDALRMAAFQARKAFSDQSENSFSDEDDLEGKDECISKLKEEDGETVMTPTGKHAVSLHAHAGSILQRRRAGPGVRSPFSAESKQGSRVDALSRSESARVADLEMGLRGSPLVQPRSASFTGESPTKRISYRRHENILFHEGRRSSFSKGNPHVFLNVSGAAVGALPGGAMNPTSSSPLRRGTTVKELIYEHGDDASPERSQYSHHSHQSHHSVSQVSQRSDSQCSHSSQNSPSQQSPSYLGLTRSVSINVEMIDFSGLSFGKMLGQGAEGPVYAAWYHETPVAVKRATSQTEIDVHLHAGWHDNVVNLRGLAHNGGHSYLVMELCPRGTLDMLIHKGALSTSSNVDPTKLLPIARSIARGMLHLHCRLPAIFHRDLKPANIFIGHGFVMKIGDFGMARYAVQRQNALPPSGTNYAGRLDRTLTPGVIGTAAYSAPEVLSPTTPRAGTKEDPSLMLKADVYSFGVILWELLSRKRPFADMDGFQIQTQWVLDPESMRFSAVEIPPGLDPAGKKVMELLNRLIVRCCSWEPRERPSFDVILKEINEMGGGGSPTKRAGTLVSPF